MKKIFGECFFCGGEKNGKGMEEMLGEGKDFLEET